MRSGEMGCMMIQKKLSRPVSLAAQQERQKKFDCRLDGDCWQAKHSWEKTFSMNEKKRECEEKERRLVGN